MVIQIFDRVNGSLIDLSDLAVYRRRPPHVRRKQTFVMRTSILASGFGILWDNGLRKDLLTL